MTAGDFARLCRSFAPEAIEALRAALSRPGERVAAAKALLEHALPPGSLAATAETDGPVGCKFVIPGARDDIEGEASSGLCAGKGAPER